MTIPRNTRSAAREIGVSVAKLVGAIYHGRVTPPIKDEGGKYAWFPEDIERARQVLQIDRRRKVVSA
jgi:hypothetical protein